jgi:hypothetical protein
MVQQFISNDDSQVEFNRMEQINILEQKINAATNLTTVTSGNLTSTTIPSTPNTIVRYDGAGGKTIKGSGVSVSDSNAISGAVGIGNTAGITFGSGTAGALTLTSSLYNGTAFNGQFLQLNGAGVIAPAAAAATLVSGTAAVTIGTSASFDVNIVTNNKHVLVGKTNGSVTEVTLGSTSEINVIYLNGAVEYNYKEAPAGGGQYLITDDDYFVKFTGTVSYGVQLLTAVAHGRTLLLRNSTNQNMGVTPLNLQTIGDGTGVFNVPAGVTLKLMADGGTDWLII